MLSSWLCYLDCYLHTWSAKCRFLPYLKPSHFLRVGLVQLFVSFPRRRSSEAFRTGQSNFSACEGWTVAFEPGSWAWRTKRGLDQVLLFTILLSQVHHSLTNFLPIFNGQDAKTEAVRLSSLPRWGCGAVRGARAVPTLHQTAAQTSHWAVKPGSAVSTAGASPTPSTRYHTACRTENKQKYW